MRIALSVLLVCLVSCLFSPAAVAQLPPANAGDLLVSSSSNNKLLRLAFDGRTLSETSVNGLRHPRGIVVAADDSIFVISQNSNEVLVLDNQLRLVRRFPTKNVSSPTGAAFGPNGNLYVGGFSSNNIGEYRPDGTFVRTYGGGGLSSTNCVAFRGDGGFYGASASTGMIVEFNAAGTAIRSFTGFGLSSPMGIAIHKGEVFVAGGGSSNIVVFDSGGKALRQVRHADISGPQGIAFLADGTFAVSNFFNDKISWFRKDGTHVRTVLPPSSRVPRSIAFLPGMTTRTTTPPKYAAPFAVEIESSFEPGLVYVMALSFGSSPGIKLGDGRLLGLDPDALFVASVGFPGFVGVLDARGRASVGIVFPKLTTALRIHQAALSIDATRGLLFRQVAATNVWDLKP